jgi:hypothetical protein
MKRLWVLGSSVLLLVPACSDSNRSGSSPIGDGPSLAGLLHAVPDTADSRGNPVYYGNLTVVRAGQLPDNFDDDLALLVENSSGQVFLPDAVRSGIREPEFAQFAGFDTRQIAVALGTGASRHGGRAGGHDEVGRHQKGLEASPAVSDHQGQVGGHVPVLGDDGASDFGSVSPIRRVGQPLRLAIEGDTLTGVVPVRRWKPLSVRSECSAVVGRRRQLPCGGRSARRGEGGQRHPRWARGGGELVAGRPGRDVPG